MLNTGRLLFQFLGSQLSLSNYEVDLIAVSV